MARPGRRAGDGDNGFVDLGLEECLHLRVACAVTPRMCRVADSGRISRTGLAGAERPSGAVLARSLAGCARPGARHAAVYPRSMRRPRINGQPAADGGDAVAHVGHSPWSGCAGEAGLNFAAALSWGATVAISVSEGDRRRRLDSARLTARFGQLRRATRFDREERSQHQANLRLQSGRIPGFSRPGRLDPLLRALREPGRMAGQNRRQCAQRIRTGR